MKMKKMKWRVAAQKFVLFASVRLDFFLTSRSAGKDFFFIFLFKGGGRLMTLATAIGWIRNPPLQKIALPIFVLLFDLHRTRRNV